MLVCGLSGVAVWRIRTAQPSLLPLQHTPILIPAQIPSRVPPPIEVPRIATSTDTDEVLWTPTRTTGATEAAAPSTAPRRADAPARVRSRNGAGATAAALPELPALSPVELNARIVGAPAVPLPSLPVVQSPPAASVANAVASRPPEMESVLHALNQYAEALSNMDVGGARRIWPGVDHRALTGAFSTLEKNEMVLNACAVDVGAHNTASVICQARVEFVPKVG